MNAFGKIFRVTIFGESHGPFVGVVVDGCPAGLSVSEQDFDIDLERRKGGLQKGATPRKEDDVPQFLSGVFKGYTTGSPLTIAFANSNIRSEDYEQAQAIPRPGHADMVAGQKFGGFQDYRGGGHFSGRMTVCVVAAGVIAKKILQSISVRATIIEIGGEKNIDNGLQRAIDAKDSVGGIVECIATGLPPGIGDPFFDSLESLISHAVFAIPAIKGIEFGKGFKAASMFGSEHNDAIADDTGKTVTNHSGGISGGLSNGNDIVFRVVVKPTSSTPKQQTSYNTESGMMQDFTIKGRHDLCIALRVPPVLEAVTAVVLADLMLAEQKVPKVFP